MCSRVAKTRCAAPVLFPQVRDQSHVSPKSNHVHDSPLHVFLHRFLIGSFSVFAQTGMHADIGTVATATVRPLQAWLGHRSKY